MIEEWIQQSGWERRYRDDDTPWDRGERAPQLADWLDRGVVGPCRILVPGCGAGHEVVDLCRRGFEVTAIDVAPTAIEIVERRLVDAGLEAECLCADVFEYQPPVVFDAVYEQACLCAFAPAHWGDYRDKLQHWLRDGGILLASFMQTGRDGGPPWHCDLVAMQRLFRNPPWRWEEIGTLVEHPAGLREMPAVLRLVGGSADRGRAP